MNRPEYDEDTQRALKLFVTLARCANSVMAYSTQDITRHGLKPSEFGVLEMLYHKGPSTLGDVAERILLTTGSITYVIDQLEKKGLVRRKPCDKDRRVLYAELTEKGQEKIASIFPEHAEHIRQVFAALSPEEQEAATALLKQLGHAAKDALS